MVYTKKVLDLIKSNRALRFKLAYLLDINEPSLIKAIERNSSTLQRYHAVVLIQQETGLKPEEIFEEGTKPALKLQSVTNLQFETHA